MDFGRLKAAKVPEKKKRDKKSDGRLHEGTNNKNAIIGTLITGRLIEVAV